MSQSSLDFSTSTTSDDPEYLIPTPKTPTHDTSRDIRLKVQTLYLHAGWTKDDIALQLNLTPYQVQYAISHRITPQKKRSGRQPLLGPAERKQLVEWVCASRKNRRTPWKDIPSILGWDCAVYAIETAFKIEGFARRTALRKPVLTAVHKAARLQWALEHVNWTQEQWDQVLWTDETWVQPGKHKKVRVTRRPGEVLHPDCLEPKIQRRIGWMFWGSISGLYGKGPGIFWEKDWGSISSASYCQHIVPTLTGYCHENRLLLMQDNASSHSSQATRAELRLRGISPIFWPANSPDLNPIETIWDYMKDYIEEKYPEIHKSYPRLREAVAEAWNAVTNEVVRELIRSMPARCQAVIDAQGGHTKY
jgi:ketohexokinase/beta-glucosidase